MVAPGPDLPQQLYLALRKRRSVAKILDAADAKALRRPSEWVKRRLAVVGAALTEKDPYATRGLTALHVLVRDCADVVVVGRAIELAGPIVLQVPGGFLAAASNGKPGFCLPMHYAAGYNSSAEVVQLMLANGGVKQLRAKTSEGWLPIHYAAGFSSSAKVVRLILAKGGVEQLMGVDQLQSRTSEGLLPIHVAARFSSSANVVQAILEKGGVKQLRVKDAQGRLPIHLAARFSSSAEVVQLILDKGGADQLETRTCEEIRNKFRQQELRQMGLFALQKICKASGVDTTVGAQGKAELVRRIVEAKPAPTAEGGWLPIHYAAGFSSSAEVMQAILAKGSMEQQLQAKTLEGMLPIHLAARFSSSADVVQAIIVRGGVQQLQVKDSQSRLPIHVAARLSSSAEVVQAILDAAGVEQLQTSTHGELKLLPLSAITQSAAKEGLGANASVRYQLRRRRPRQAKLLGRRTKQQLDPLGATIIEAPRATAQTTSVPPATALASATGGLDDEPSRVFTEPSDGAGIGEAGKPGSH
jgi:ankyrin repeat protein